MARILVVEDEPDILDAMAMILERSGHAVAKALDGATAADMHRDAEFDLIVSDLSMPGLDGIELARAVRAGSRCDVPILLVTASATSQDLDLAREAGITAYLGKPYRLAELREQVASLLNDD